MITKKLAAHPYAQCEERFNADGSYEFISYSTAVIVITADDMLYVTGLYSATTRRHISWWASEHGFTYQFLKSLFVNGECYDLSCREAIKI